MQKTHGSDAERPFVRPGYCPHYARREREKVNQRPVEYIRKLHDQGDTMTIRKERRRRAARPIAGALARPRELFGESLPELLLVSAVVAAVVSGVAALSGAG
jgi:hypothetical protein